MSAHVLSAHVSTKRVQTFLAQDETDKYKNLTPSEDIGFRNATCTHSSTDPTAAANGFALRDLDFTFPRGQLSLVTGPVGSGKVRGNERPSLVASADQDAVFYSRRLLCCCRCWARLSVLFR